MVSCVHVVSPYVGLAQARLGMPLKSIEAPYFVVSLEVIQSMTCQFESAPFPNSEFQDVPFKFSAVMNLMVFHKS